LYEQPYQNITATLLYNYVILNLFCHA